MSPKVLYCHRSPFHINFFPKLTELAGAGIKVVPIKILS